MRHLYVFVAVVCVALSPPSTHTQSQSQLSVFNQALDWDRPLWDQQSGRDANQDTRFPSPFVHSVRIYRPICQGSSVVLQYTCCVAAVYLLESKKKKKKSGEPTCADSTFLPELCKFCFVFLISLRALWVTHRVPQTQNTSRAHKHITAGITNHLRLLFDEKFSETSSRKKGGERETGREREAIKIDMVMSSGRLGELVGRGQGKTRGIMMKEGREKPWKWWDVKEDGKTVAKDNEWGGEGRKRCRERAWINEREKESRICSCLALDTKYIYLFIGTWHVSIERFYVRIKKKKQRGKTASAGAQIEATKKGSGTVKKRGRMSKRKAVVMGSCWCQEAPLRPNTHSFY